MSQNAAKYLESVKQKAAEIVTAAQNESKQIREQAERQGRAAAEQAARKAAQHEVTKKWQSLEPALQQAISAVQTTHANWAKQWEQNMLELVVAIAQRVIRRELTNQPEISHQWIREAVELASGSNQLTLRLNPQDFAALGEQRGQIEEHFHQLAEAKIVADPEVSRGGCRVTTEHGQIDQQIESQLDRIVEELNL
jgi:flagellar assembly protein FliH